LGKHHAIALDPLDPEHYAQKAEALEKLDRGDEATKARETMEERRKTGRSVRCRRRLFLIDEAAMTKKTVIVRHERPDWTDWYVENLAAEFPDHDFRKAHSLEDAMAHAPEAHAFIGIGPQMPPALVAAMPRLE